MLLLAVGAGATEVRDIINRHRNNQEAEYFTGTSRGRGSEAERKALEEVVNYLKSKDKNYIGIGGFEKDDWSYDPVTDTTSFQWRIR